MSEIWLKSWLSGLYQENCRIDPSYYAPGMTFVLLEAGNGEVAFQGKETVGKSLEWPLWNPTESP